MTERTKTKATADTPAVPTEEASPETRKAYARAAGRIRKRLDGGEERVQVSIRKTGANSSTRDAVHGMSDAELTVRLGDALGTTSVAFIDEMSAQLLTYFDAKNDVRATREMNAALAVLDGIKPENEVEAMLVTQMIATNDAAMKCLAQIGHGMGTETFGGLGVKLLRTYTAQVEALAKLRRKGEQTVKVVHVYPGGQAVVGDVHHHRPEGGAHSRTEGQPDGTGQSSPGPALSGPDPLRDGVPLPGDAERQMSPARRAVTGGAEG